MKTMIVGVLTVIFAVQPLASVVAQQLRRKVSTDTEGNHQVMDPSRGITVTEKNGKTTTMSAADATKLCSDLDKYWVLTRNAEGESTRELCEEWGEVQQRTKIEKIPFSTLVVRLLLATPSSTSFDRYRGLELKKKGTSQVFDTTILPSNIGAEPSCVVEEEDRSSQGMLYTYQCEVKLIHT